MFSPFPGMDPYLEHPELWPEVQNRLIVAMAVAIGSYLRPKYKVAIETRTYWIEDTHLAENHDINILSKKSTVNKPEMIASKYQPISVMMPMPIEVNEGYIEIKNMKTGKVITIIEILFPQHKHSCGGRQLYERLRQKRLLSSNHLIEIDLLRIGKPMPVLGKIPNSDYRILISRGNKRPQAQLYAFNVREEIPSFPLPLQSKEAEPLIVLQALLREVYQQAAFDLTLDYSRDPIPPLNLKDAAWADSVLRKKGLR
jgi:hypothetical protein